MRIYFLLGLLALAKVAISVAAVSPLAPLMGLPFPGALKQLAEDDVPWAWGINGTASVLSPMCATLVALHLDSPL